MDLQNKQSYILMEWTSQTLHTGSPSLWFSGLPDVQLLDLWISVFSPRNSAMVKINYLLALTLGLRELHTKEQSKTNVPCQLHVIQHVSKEIFIYRLMKPHNIDSVKTFLGLEVHTLYFDD